MYQPCIPIFKNHVQKPHRMMSCIPPCYIHNSHEWLQSFSSFTGRDVDVQEQGYLWTWDAPWMILCMGIVADSVVFSKQGFATLSIIVFHICFFISKGTCKKRRGNEQRQWNQEQKAPAKSIKQQAICFTIWVAEPAIKTGLCPWTSASTPKLQIMGKHANRLFLLIEASMG